MGTKKKRKTPTVKTVKTVKPSWTLIDDNTEDLYGLQTISLVMNIKHNTDRIDRLARFTSAVLSHDAALARRALTDIVANRDLDWCDGHDRRAEDLYSSVKSYGHRMSDLKAKFPGSFGEIVAISELIQAVSEYANVEAGIINFPRGGAASFKS